MGLKVEQIQQFANERDRLTKEAEKNYQEVKAKLHDAYKEYLALTETAKRLEMEAELGSESVRNRNDILQKNLDRLAKDFEITSKDLTSNQLKNKEMDFELEEIALQFNQCGEAKRSLEAEKVRLMAELSNTSTSLFF